MYTTNLTTLRPEAYITVKKNRLKLYEEKNHYLKDKSKFEIELFNPTGQKVLAKISLNGKQMASGIIIAPGERVYLERFLESPEKFQFNTFEVDDVKETKKARDTNGVVSISFYREQFSGLLYGNGTTSTVTTYPNHTLTIGAPYHNNMVYTTNTAQGICGSVSSGNALYSSTSINTVAGTNIRSAVATLDTVETGRVAEGGKSKQKLQKANGKFNDYTTETFVYQLLPESLKVANIGDIRAYCGECGVRIRKSSWKYCPNCGNTL
jgi:hypothetical protein